MSDNSDQRKPTWRQRLRKGPVLVAGTVLTTLLTASATWFANDLLNKVHQADPVGLSVETDPARISGVSPADRFGVIPSSIETHGTPGSQGCNGFHAWMRDNHGTDAGETVLQITAQGMNDKPVLLQNMRVKITDTSAPMSGIAVRCPPAGNAQLRSIAVNLDATPPTVDYQSHSNAPFGFTLQKGETESFIVTAKAAKATYNWTVELDAVINGTAKTLHVGPTNGFTTTPKPTAAWEWNYKDSWTNGNRIIPAPTPLPPIP
jgi:hypothetical protein